MNNQFLKTAIVHLQKDPILSSLIQKYDPPVWSPSRDIFQDLVTSIINQQLSNKAAATISSRFQALYAPQFPTPQKILKTPDHTIRKCGISYPKISYIKDLSQNIINKTLILKDLPKLSDKEVANQLTKTKGIGDWTAEMILIFSLGRPDVFSIGDLGLRTAVSRLYKVDRKDLDAIQDISLNWKPYRSTASRYLWKSLDE